jgi:hypothetical protein
MKKENRVWVFMGAMLFLVVFGLFYFSPIQKEIISVKFVVGENMGFGLGDGILNFGQIVPGNGATRNVSVENDFDRPVRIKIKSSGDVSRALSVSGNDFVLSPRENRNVSFSVYVDDGFEFGEYSGEVVILSWRKYW